MEERTKITSVDVTLPNEVIKQMMKEQYFRVYSTSLDKKVYVLQTLIPKELFKKYKKFFGYCDVGWTVKKPRMLIQAMVNEGIWHVPEAEINA